MRTAVGALFCQSKHMIETAVSNHFSAFSVHVLLPDDFAHRCAAVVAVTIHKQIQFTINRFQMHGHLCFSSSFSRFSSFAHLCSFPTMAERNSRTFWPFLFSLVWFSRGNIPQVSDIFHSSRFALYTVVMLLLLGWLYDSNWQQRKSKKIHE